MTFTFTVSPDFPPADIAGWYVLNTFLQRRLGEHIHLELYDGFEQQRSAIDRDEIDLIYANPFDAAALVRDHGFRGLVRPDGVRDEAVLVVPASSSVMQVEDLRPGCRVVCTDDPDVRMSGMIMLEPADLDRSTIELTERSTYVLAAKSLLSGEADVAIFLADAYEGLSRSTRSGLRPQVTSQIGVISHLLMVGPRFAPHADDLRTLLLAMDEDASERTITEGLGFSGWLPVDPEETEFMIDLMDTLLAD